MPGTLARGLSPLRALACAGCSNPNLPGARASEQPIKAGEFHFAISHRVREHGFGAAVFLRENGGFPFPILRAIRSAPIRTIFLRIERLAHNHVPFANRSVAADLPA